MRTKNYLPGLNVQWPWSTLLLTGRKIIETRHYPLPKKYIGKEIALIETPGPRGKQDAGIETSRVVGVVVFSGSFLYDSYEAWLADYPKHQVSPDDPIFGYSKKKKKWGWIVSSVRTLKSAKPAPPKRGIVFSSRCEI